VFHLDNTLRESKAATFDVLTYDRDLLWSPVSDLQLIAKCREGQPDAVIVSSWGKAPRHPSIEALAFVREHLGIRLVALWWDSCSVGFWKSVRPIMEHFDVHVIMDNPTLYHIDRQDALSERIIALWPPQDETLFHPGTIQDIPVSFLGQVSSYRSYRSDAINFLVEKQVPGYFATRDRDQQVSHNEYADIMRRSKISLNFSYSVSSHQLKSRVLEVMFSGAMLLESDNAQTSKLFTPMKDYVPFTSKEDLVEKIRYYLRNEDQLTAIARQGRSTAASVYNASRFWELLCQKLNESGAK